MSIDVIQQRPVCLGKLIGGERPDECSGCGCPLHSIAVDATAEMAQGAPQIIGPDILESLQKAYDIAQDSGNSQQGLAKQIMDQAENTGIAHLVQARRSVTECPHLSPPSPPLP